MELAHKERIMTPQKETINVPFSDIEKEWCAVLPQAQKKEYLELNKETARALIKEYCETLGTDDYKERFLRPPVCVILKSQDTSPELIRNIVERFFELKEKHHPLWLSTRPLMRALANPNCPPDLLVVAFLSPYCDLAQVAEANPNLPIEYQVLGALRNKAS